MKALDIVAALLIVGIVYHRRFIAHLADTEEIRKRVEEARDRANLPFD